ncbi:hypothetical protein SODALDRAFT_358757 [Sodiomyces alkalinus F11]|uniref:Uncharacterized protein n=1 Tax=Sodiomyces alkalinus (strain CBS 110278 / VKM F-3762 / F11) TaxID=1314773 RepID=A0A3N2PWZ5_SODAK|nr:hypothetical protein SODALDRAFT_358757 [Sodiomyces alkalinus F11]ROT38926.1 hypothetical protein SODALDRAFT_358757 [Sodiomyces alkalinus F11]
MHTSQPTNRPTDNTSSHRLIIPATNDSLHVHFQLTCHVISLTHPPPPNVPHPFSWLQSLSALVFISSTVYPIHQPQARSIRRAQTPVSRSLGQGPCRPRFSVANRSFTLGLGVTQQPSSVDLVFDCLRILRFLKSLDSYPCLALAGVPEKRTLFHEFSSLFINLIFSAFASLQVVHHRVRVPPLVDHDGTPVLQAPVHGSRPPRGATGKFPGSHPLELLQACSIMQEACNLQPATPPRNPACPLGLTVAPGRGRPADCPALSRLTADVAPLDASLDVCDLHPIGSHPPGILEPTRAGANWPGLSSKARGQRGSLYLADEMSPDSAL